MQQPYFFRVDNPIRKAVLVLRRRRALRRLNKGVFALSARDMSDLLDKAGKNRSELFTSFRGNARHRQRMGHMLQRFHIDLETAVEHCWSDILNAEWACMHCSNTGRCHRWFDWGFDNNAPAVFCPNAELFGQMQFAQQRAVRAHARGHPTDVGTATAKSPPLMSRHSDAEVASETSFWQEWLKARLDRAGTDRSD